MTIRNHLEEVQATEEWAKIEKEHPAVLTKLLLVNMKMGR